MLTLDQRRWRADKLGNLANIVAVALIFGQVVTGTFRLTLTLLGLALIVLAYSYGHFLLKRIN